MRKLRLEKNDFVLLKLKYGSSFIVGRVDKVYINNRKDWKEWEIYGYTIYWDSNGPVSTSGWTLKDISSGRLKYVKNRKAIQVLYGRKNI